MKRISFIFLLSWGLFSVACSTDENCDLAMVAADVSAKFTVAEQALDEYILDETNVENCQEYKEALDALIVARTNLLDCNPTEDSRTSTETTLEIERQRRNDLPCN